MISLVLEGTRKAFGLPLPLVALFFTAYMVFGHHLPQPFHHPSLSLGKIVSHLSIGLRGIYGPILNASANMIFLFIVFGAVLQRSGAPEFFLQLGRLLACKLSGGAALTSVVGSGLIGMTSGSVSSNILITGAFTIPLMKKAGYKAEQAGAIETMASMGGMIMPPIMGASIFIMADITGIPYITICGSAIVIAILYYINLGLAVQFLAMKENISLEVEKVEIRSKLWKAPIFFGSLAVISILLIKGYSPAYCAFWGIWSVVGITSLTGIFKKEARLSLKSWLDGFTSGAEGGAQLCAACACIGLMTTALSVTGLGIKIGGAVEMYSQGYLIVALLISAGVCILIGIEMPAVAAYMLCAITVCPALRRMGVDLLAAHLFAYMFAIFSAVTPPVATGSLIASKVAGADYFKTALYGFRFSLSILLIPFLIIWCPELLGRFSSFFSGTVVLAAVLVAQLSFIVVLFGHYLTKVNVLERFLFGLTCGELVVFTYTRSFIHFSVGLFIFIFLTIAQLKRSYYLNMAIRQLFKQKSVEMSQDSFEHE